MTEVGRGLGRLSALAATRHGVVTVDEASGLGVTRGQIRAGVERGDWHRPHRGVLVAAAAPTTWLQSCAIAALAARGVISHRAAARLHGLDGFHDAAPELTVPAGRHMPVMDCDRHRSVAFDASDRTVVWGIPVTSVARTLADLGAVADDDQVEQALDDALRRGHSMRWIVATLERVDRPGPSGASTLRRVLARPDRQGPIPDSRFERLMERSCRAAGVSQPQRQHEVRDSNGALIARLDAAWPELMLGIEAHSERWHFGPKRGREDQLRDNRLTALGWQLLYVGWWDIEHPMQFHALLRETHAVRTPRPA